MKMYKVAVVVSAEQFMSLFPRIGKDFQLEIKEIDSGPKDLFQNAPKRGGRRKGSKVNAAVLGALANGPQTVKQLKSALENAGLSAGSLSTALANLQNSGALSRTAEGIYDLRQAAQ